MKTNTKGFTLIELLAVIVILAIIALIASPIILGIIQNAREASQARSVEQFASAIQDAVAEVMYDTNYGGGDVTVNETTGVVTAPAATGEAQITKTPTYSGSKVSCKSIEYKDGFLKMTGCSVGGSTTLTFKYNNNPNDADTTRGSAVKEATGE